MTAARSLLSVNRQLNAAETDTLCLLSLALSHPITDSFPAQHDAKHRASVRLLQLQHEPCNISHLNATISSRDLSNNFNTNRDVHSRVRRMVRDTLPKCRRSGRAQWKTTSAFYCCCCCRCIESSHSVRVDVCCCCVASVSRHSAPVLMSASRNSNCCAVLRLSLSEGVCTATV